ncbi:MAG: aminotransferase [Gammaproteobacteria bacterium]|nr:aminotransferase [Gammaproteobacteria bacterium]
MNYNPNVLNCAAAPIAEAWSWVADRQSANLIDMCQAVPAHLPPQSLRDYLADTIRNGDGASYTDIRGITPLREALAHNISSRYMGDCDAQDIIITAGCNQAFCSVIDALCQQGDEVILPLPCYFNHQMWLSTRGIDIKYLCFDPQSAQPNPHQAAELVTSHCKAIVLVTPNNPTGATYSPECIEQFYQLARENNLALIVDETYRDFIEGIPHNLFQQPDWRKNFIHLYSFSKVYSLTGHRTGAVAAGSELIEQLKKVQDCTAICAPHAGQLAALYGLQNLHDWKLEKAAELRHRANLIKQAMSRPELSYRLISAGAYFAYIEHPFDASSRHVVRSLIKDFELLSLPGSYFGHQQDKFIRLAFANVEEKYFDEVVNRLIQSQSALKL